jgi:hypothetical protein
VDGLLEQVRNLQIKLKCLPLPGILVTFLYRDEFKSVPSTCSSKVLGICCHIDWNLGVFSGVPFDSLFVTVVMSLRAILMTTETTILTILWLLKYEDGYSLCELRSDVTTRLLLGYGANRSRENQTRHDPTRHTNKTQNGFSLTQNGLVPRFRQHGGAFDKKCKP